MSESGYQLKFDIWNVNEVFFIATGRACSFGNFSKKAILGM